MVQFKRVRPGPGATVLHPETRVPIAAEGQRVPLHPDVTRALRRGDLEEVPELPAPAPAAPAPTASKTLRTRTED